MKRQHFPTIALALAVPLLGALWLGGESPVADPESGPRLPLLTLLMISEFGLIICLAGSVLGVQHGRHQGWTGRQVLTTMGCGLAALAFLLQLIRWWPL
ncbi:hypothetical protein [Halochromatium sp.]